MLSIKDEICAVVTSLISFGVKLFTASFKAFKAWSNSSCVTFSLFKTFLASSNALTKLSYDSLV